MINGKRVLAYIPARSGSKSIIHKNIIDVCGKPLIAYSILAAKESKYVDKVIISTDSAHYAEIARTWGADAPFLRPPELAGDTSVEMDACQHLIRWVDTTASEKFDFIIKLEPTSPLRIGKDIDQAIEMLVNKDADTVVTVTEVLTHPFWMNVLPPDNSMKGFLKPGVEKLNRQQLPKYYQLDGLVYVAKWDFIKNKKTWFAENCFATITPGERALDIDEPIQMDLLKLIIQKRNQTATGNK